MAEEEEHPVPLLNPPRPYLLFHVIWAVEGGPGEEGREVRVQGGLRLCPKGQHFQAGIRLP